MGASAIAIAPVAIPPDVKISAVPTSSAAVDLVVNPVDFYAEVFGRSADNVAALVDIFLANPAPILSQIFDNQLANAEVISGALEQIVDGLVPILTQQVPMMLETAFNALAEGDVETALNTLLSIPTAVAALPAFIGLGAVLLPISTAVNNFNNIVQQVLGNAILGGAVAAFGPVLSTIGAGGTAIQGILDGVAAGDIGEVADAFVNVPAVLIDGLLNGGYGPPLFVVPAPGLLSPNGLLGSLGAGPIGFVLAIRNLVAQAITPIAVSSTAVQRTAGDPDAVEGLAEVNSIASKGQTVTVSTEDIQTPAEGATPEPQGGTPAPTTDGDVPVGTEVAPTVTEVTEVDEGSGAEAIEVIEAGEVIEPGETSKPAKVRPGQDLRKDLQKAGERAQQQIERVGKQIGGAIDRLTGRDTKKTTGTKAGGSTAGGGTGGEGAAGGGESVGGSGS